MIFMIKFTLLYTALFSINLVIVNFEAPQNTINDKLIIATWMTWKETLICVIAIFLYMLFEKCSVFACGNVVNQLHEPWLESDDCMG